MLTVKRDRLNKLAAELRMIAEELRDDRQYKLVLSVAKDYERLAKGQPRPPKLKTIRS
jgi:hypothetical protein